MLRTVACAIWLLPLLVAATACLAANECPGSPEAFIFEPYGFFSEVFSEPEAALWDQGYDIVRHIDRTCDLDPGFTTLTNFEAGLRHGYGVFCVASHGDPSGFAVEAYDTTLAGEAAADSAYWAYRNSGIWEYGEIYVGQSHHGNAVCIADNAVASIDKGFVSDESIVYMAPCHSWELRWAWTGAREYLGYPGEPDSQLVRSEAWLFWDRMNGEHGKDMRCVAAAKSGLSISHQDLGATVLAPAVQEFAPASWIYASKDSFYCTVHFDCLMDTSDCVVSGDETYCYVDSVRWKNDTTLVFTVHGTGTNGTGQILIDACWATSAGNGTCLDGNTDPGGTDGHGPSGDDFVLEYRFWDNPAAAIDFLEVSQGQIIWGSSQEDGTVAYRLLGSNDPEGGLWQVASEEIPAQGAPAEYSAPVPAGWDYVKLQEKEDRYCGERWIDHGICATNPPMPSAPADHSPSGPPFLHIIGLDENVGAIESFLERMAGAGVGGRYDVLPEIGNSIVDQALATHQHGDTLVIIWPRPNDGAQQEGVEKGERRVWGVGVVGPEGYENTLNAYRDALNEPIHWPPGEAFVAQTYLIQGAQDSATVCGWINDDHGGEYWVLFGRVDECNSPDSTTMPCPYLPDPPDPVRSNCVFTLWDWERGLSDTVAKYIGYVPVDNINDLWVYWAKMVDYKWNSDWIDYKRRLGAWAKDEDTSGRSGAYVRDQMESVLELAHPAWEVNTLWASELSCFTGAATDSSLSALSEGRSLVIVLGTYSNPRRLCSFLCTSPSWCCYADIRSELADTHRYAQFLALSCQLHLINKLSHRPAVAQELLLVPYGGAVASVGPSGGFYQDYYHMYLAKFMDIYNEEGGDMTIGQMHKRTRNSLLADSPSDSLMSLFCKTLPLLGDPTVKVGGPNSSMYLAVEESGRRSSSKFALQNPVPNPFNPTVALSFSLPEPTHMSLRIYNIHGQLVRNLLDGWADAGEHQVIWDGKNDRGEIVGSGIYFCQIVSGKHSRTTKLVLLK
ncbi:MAG: T9SS type A sorting domain-containing protein [Candidatus Eisenbacteria sp.]|nr:T9SS type A sorting domain-containing protein [Candidatus Eisenbacteria bacterium]